MNDLPARIVKIPAAGVTLDGDLVIPAEARGLVLFAHGSGSSRKSPRNRYVAGVLNDGKIATLLMDLLTHDEEAQDLLTAQFRFDIPLLAERVLAATDWVRSNRETQNRSVGYFGASTGAAAALVAAAVRPEVVRAIVSRGGRPDLAGSSLAHVRAPTLLIVGGEDDVVIELNQEAFKQLQVEKKLVIIPGATHLFEEKGALEQVAALARGWFSRWLTS